MNNNSITSALYILEKYIRKVSFKGYDPYDTLLSWIPFKRLGKWGPILAIQIQKRNPFNIRPLIGISKGFNPKAMGLFLQAYSILFQKTNNTRYRDLADYFFNWLKNNYSVGYSGHCWGYNFPWASPVKYMESYIPSSVVTGFVCKGIWQYYKISQNQEASQLIISASKFIEKDLPTYTDDTGICISYTPLLQDICYNASLLAAEVLAMNFALTGDQTVREKCESLVNFVVSRQKADGHWNYSLDLKTNKEREQIDFHQGYILESIAEIQKNLEVNNQSWSNSLQEGLNYYYNNQFFKDGCSLWRVPEKYPVDIHNQSQGIITFFKLSQYDEKYKPFAFKIADWTIKNMQSKKGYFYYRKNKLIDHKIPYIRWSQAWMFLALSHLTE